ncbi:endoribonuclease L-PSP [Pandoraea communis]|uniref:Endoribonuclease L-PSP n=2 Tax=Pandoraea communis TaxID=2508297 RepID=A0A5E4WMK0_9BURK|nr:endoribonuclease L-PSP [Pandoraea communis]
MKEWPAFNNIYKSYFTEGKYPARSAFGVNGMAFDARVEVECMASKSPEA